MRTIRLDCFCDTHDNARGLYGTTVSTAWMRLANAWNGLTRLASRLLEEGGHPLY